MEILIGILLLGLVGMVVFALKVTTEDSKKAQAVEDEKTQKLAGLQSAVEKKDAELKEVMELRRKLEEEYFKVKDEAGILQKDNSEIAQKLKQMEKSREELSALRSELKEKDAMAQQETISRQKLQGELSLRDIEIDRLQKAIEAVKSELKAKTEMYDGLKGQFDEMENVLQKAREGDLKKVDSKKGEPKAKHEDSKVEGVMPETPIKAEPVKESHVEKAPEKMAPEAKSEAAREPVVEKPVEKIGQEIPGFPSAKPVKHEAGQGIPSDTDFLKTDGASKNDTQAPPSSGPASLGGVVPEGAFKFTNVNKSPASQGQEKKDARDKPKPDKETLIDGFHA